ncbi:MAG: tetratricopeptide repeat protein [Alphaproteobacteria bacterium]|nr:tetratricopeptide repeat protein [Alphaproteobacteria bacterium]
MNIKSLCIALLILINGYASAEFKKGTAIRDAEIEKILKNYLDPLFKVAGLNPEEARIVMIVESALNAAALPNNTLLFYTGFLMETENPEEIAGVLAHEVGHIAARHLVRMYGAMENAQKVGLLGALVGIAVGLLGSPDAGLALALGGSSQALHTFLHYRRSEEEAADMLAVKYLEALKWPIRGLRTFLTKLLGQELLSEKLQDPYLRTHPLTQDRVERIRAKEIKSPKAMPNLFQEQHHRMVVKLKAFLWAPEKTLEKFKGNTPLDLYAQSIAYYRQADFDKALSLIETLIKTEPTNPFFWEFKGQILFDSGRIKESIVPYKKAIDLFPESALLNVALAQSLLQNDTEETLKEAVMHLQKALQKETDSGLAWQYLAIAYGKQNKMAQMALALSEHGLLTQQWDYAKEQAIRAQHFCKKSDKEYRRAEEIKNIAEQKLKEEKKGLLP